MMKLSVWVAIVVMLCGSFALAEEKPPIDIPIYPGGEPTLEVNLTNEEFLPMLQTFLPLLSNKLGELAEKIKPEEIAEALKDLKRIEVVQLDVAKSGVTELDVASFYAKSIPPGSWSRLFFQSSDKIGTVALYALPSFGGFYGFRISKVEVEGKTIHRAMVGKIEGTIDFVKLLEMAAKLAVPWPTDK